MKTNIIVSEKSWNQNLIKELTKRFNSYNWILINEKSNFNSKYLNNFNVEKIFIPHWSYIIEKDIYESYECIVFHMTDLPFGRGGSPLQNLIVRKIYETKISAIKVQEGIDTGDIYLKEDLNLDGSASEIFKRANKIIKKMISEILENKLTSYPQEGEVVKFNRRKTEQSNIDGLMNLVSIYDYIRMLDADGYPKAFIENKHFKFEFFKARFEKGEEVRAEVIITKK